MRKKDPLPALDRAKLELIVVGQSSRSEVFAALARRPVPERSAQGETWIYETRDKGNRESILSGAAAGSALLGAFVPYAGLVDSGVGLASVATGGGSSPTETSSLSVVFGADGIVRDCLYVTTASPRSSKGNLSPRAAECRIADARFQGQGHDPALA